MARVLVSLVTHNESRDAERPLPTLFPQTFPDFALVAGNPETALSEPHTIVLSDRLAKAMFGSSDPMGQVVRHELGRTYRVTGIVKDTGQNIVVTYTVPDPARELIFAAHYDSKTAFWDHVQRAKIYRFIPLAFILGLALAIFTFFTRRYSLIRKKGPAIVSIVLAGVLVVYWGLVFLGFGG